jgi:hypothetical protein
MTTLDMEPVKVFEVKKDGLRTYDSCPSTLKKILAGRGQKLFKYAAISSEI